MLSKIFTRKTTPMLGIDISSASVKLLGLSKDGERYQVNAFSIVPLPEGAVVEKEIKESDIVIAAISKAVALAHTHNKNAAIALADSSVISKVIQMDAALAISDQEIEEQIMLSADKHIPYPIDEVCLDFQILGPNKGDKRQVDVLLAASRAASVANFVEALIKAGLTTRVVEVQSYVMGKVCNFLEKDSIYDAQNTKPIITAVIDLGARSTTISMYENDFPIFTRTELFGGERLTKAIAVRYGMTFEDAEQAKLLQDLPENYPSEVLNVFKEDIIQHIHRGIQFYSSSTRMDHIDKIILAGGCSTLPGLDTLVKEKLNVPTVIANPFINMDFYPHINVEALKKIAPAMMIACGLALRSFDKCVV